MQHERIVRVLAIAFLFVAAMPLPAAEPDVAITAVVTAKELVFEEVPNVSVTFIGAPENVTVWTTDRQNLPDRVEPKVIYRDIGIRLTITSTLANIEQIVDEALAAAPAPKPAAAPPSKSRRARTRR